MNERIKELIEANGLTLHGDIEHFAALVEAAARADEREECAKLFETITKDPAVPPVHLSLSDTAKAIRARGAT